MPHTLDDLLNWMERYPDRVPLAELTRRLTDLQLSVDDVRPCVHFSEAHYQRNLLHAGRGFHALILCWRPGQRSPIHDHRGSSCGVRVLHGAATETFFERSPNGQIYPVSTRELPAGAVCGSQDADIHQMSNLQSDRDLVTLHIYSPPLLVMGRYSLTEDRVEEFVDPIFEFAAGAGI